MFDDIKGQTFGRLTALKCIQKTNNKVTTLWECHCSCDNDKGKDYVSCIKTARALLIDKTKSCGCLGKEKSSNKLKKDLVGKRFGRLVVLKDTLKRDHRSVVWKCQCDCGKITEVPSYSLLNGDTKSCGCLHSDIVRQQMSIDITNERYGLLIAKEPIVIDGILYWRCECDCGNKKFYAKAGSLRSGNTKSCGCLKSHGESKVQQCLEIMDIPFKREYIFKDLKGHNNKGVLRFDFYLPEQNILIEYDGNQHFFSRNCGWNNKENLQLIQENDKLKNEYCKAHNIPLIRIPYTDFEKIDIDYLTQKIYNTSIEV